MSHASDETDVITVSYTHLIIDGGHYGIEHIFIEDMRQYLEKHLSEVEIVAAPISHPFLIDVYKRQWQDCSTRRSKN